MATTRITELQLSDPSAPLHVATLTSDADGNINLTPYDTGAVVTSDLVTQALTITDVPVSPTDGVNKQYADLIAAGFSFKNPAFCATTANLNATYNNGTSGVGATLTNAGADAILVIDGQTPALNARILVKNQTSTANNGIYSITTLGTTSVPWVLTRTTDFDSADTITQGSLVPVEFGTVNASTFYDQTSVVVTVGTDPITFQIFGGTVTLPLAVTQGGTGRTTASPYQILYASATNTIGGIANAANSVLVTGPGTVPSLSATLPLAVQANITETGTVGTGTWQGTVIAPTYGGTGLATITAHGLMVGEGTGNVATIAPSATSGVLLQSQGASSDPAFGSVVFPTSLLQNHLLYGSGANIVGSLATAANSVLVTGAGSAPSFSTTLPTAVQMSITELGTVTVGKWQGTSVTPAYGGTGLTTITAHGLMVGEGVGNVTTVGPSATTGAILQSQGAAADPAFSTASYPSTAVANQILYASATNTITGLATANNSILATDGTGIPSLTQTLPTAVQTNITETGIVGTGTWQGTVVTPTYGGTGLATIPLYGLMVGQGTSSVTTVPANVTAGALLASQGAGANPSYLIPTAGAGLSLTTNGTTLQYSANAPAVATKAANYTLLTTDYFIGVTTTSGAYTMTLPAAPTNGLTYVIKDSAGNATTNSITIAGNGNTIDGSASYVINNNYGAVELIYNGTSWSIV